MENYFLLKTNIIVYKNEQLARYVHIKSMTRQHFVMQNILIGELAKLGQIFSTRRYLWGIQRLVFTHSSPPCFGRGVFLATEN